MDTDDKVFAFYITEPNNIKQLKMTKKELKNKIKIRENINWERTQELHDLAYEIVQRKIEKEFKDNEFYTVYNIDVLSDEKPPKPYNDIETITGMSILMNRVLNWKPRKQISEWTPLDKEIQHVMLVKYKILASIIILYIDEQIKRLK